MTEKAKLPATDKIEAPWTDEQVIVLNQYQRALCVHPFTGTDSNGQKVNLIATNAGWIAELGGAVVQTWAHSFMVDESFVRDRMFQSPATIDRKPGIQR